MPNKNHTLTLPISFKKFSHFSLYSTSQRFYLIGCDNSKRFYKVLKVDRTTINELQIHEDPASYSSTQIKDLLCMINDGNKITTQNAKPQLNQNDNSKVQLRGLQFVLKAYGIIGFIKFTKGYYMILITERKRVGRIGIHDIYEIKKTSFIPLFETSASSFLQNLIVKGDEQKYKEIFQTIDLTKDFYFSYTYDLSRTLQQNMTIHLDCDGPNVNYSNMFVWNSFLLEPLLPQTPSDKNWILPIIHGYIGETSILVVGKPIIIMLIGRRSRYFAGTRYLKRGINDHGHVANHVETEQIVYDCSSLTNRQGAGHFTSIVQMRGSIPLYWSQTISTKVVDPKPDIVLGKYDPLYTSTKKHFELLFKRYGTPVFCLDLVKEKEKKPRESILGKAYRECCHYLQSTGYGDKLQYISWDFRGASKKKPEKLLNEVSSIIEEVFEQTAYFCSESPFHSNGYVLQNGLLRTNCIDCLDRTNITQFFLGKYSLGHQLFAIGVLDSPHLVQQSEVVKELMNLYEEMGDVIALQYSGSPTVSAGINHRGLSWDLITNLKRYYSNNFKDENKQHAHNLFLGNYQPCESFPRLWELDSDYYLHENNESEDENDEEIAIDEKLLQGDLKKNHNVQKISEAKKKRGTAHFTSDEFFEEFYPQYEVSVINVPSSIPQISPILSNNSTISSNQSYSFPQEIDKAIIQNDHEGGDGENSNIQEKKIRNFEGKMTEVTLISSCGLDQPQVEIKTMQKHTTHLTFQPLNPFKISENDKNIYLRYMNEYDLDYSSTYNTLTDEEYWDKKIDKDNISENHGMKTVTNSTNNIDWEKDQSVSVYETYLHTCKGTSELKSSINPSNLDLYEQFCNKDNLFNTENNSNFETYSKKRVEYENILESLKCDDLHTSKKRNFVHSLVNTENVAISLTSLASNSEDNERWYGEPFELMKAYYPSLSFRQIGEKLENIIKRMRREISIKDRIRYPSVTKRLFNKATLFEMLKARLFRKCFVGNVAVDWLMKSQVTETPLKTREDATKFLNILVDIHAFHHVSYSRRFTDGYLLYRFAEDNDLRVLNMNEIYSNSTPNKNQERQKSKFGDHKDMADDAMQRYQNPCEMAASLYKQILDVFFEFAEDAKITGSSIVELEELGMEKISTDISKLFQSNKFHSFVSSTLELQRANISTLCRKEKMAFFINVHNALFLHGFLLMGCKIQVMAAYSFYRRTCYQIGGKLFSLSDIKHGIMRGNKRYVGTFSKLFNPGDPRIEITQSIFPPDPRALFILNSIKFVAAHIVSTNNLENKLQAESANFISQKVTINPEANLITVPFFFKWYSEDFEIRNDKDILSVIFYLLPQSHGMRSQLATMLKKHQGKQTKVFFSKRF